jgi:hypothetical protein
MALKRIKTDEQIYLPEYRTENQNGCWEWKGKRDTWGYGYFRRNKKPVYVHRASLQMALGRLLVPREQSLHLCDNPPCFNPSHLMSGNQKENIRQMMDRGRYKKPPDTIGISGVKGVSWVSATKSWRVTRYIGGKQIGYGSFKDLDKAIELNSTMPFESERKG